MEGNARSYRVACETHAHGAPNERKTYARAARSARQRPPTMITVVGRNDDQRCVGNRSRLNLGPCRGGGLRTHDLFVSKADGPALSSVVRYRILAFGLVGVRLLRRGRRS